MGERENSEGSFASRGELCNSVPVRASRDRLAHQSAWDEADSVHRFDKILVGQVEVV